MGEKEKIIAIIPARGGSKGIPGKNIKNFNGKPLIYYQIKLARDAKKKGIITDHIISTDDKKIAFIAKKYGGNIPFMRPNNLAADDSLVIYTMIHAVEWWEKKYDEIIHSVILLQPTNPLTTLKNIEESVNKYTRNQPTAKSLISICDAQHVRLPTLYYKDEEYLEQAIKEIDPVPRRQSLKNIYWRNGAIYITRRDLLMNEKKIVDSHPLFYHMSRFCSVTIDDMFDWTIAEFLANFNKKKSSRNFLHFNSD